MSWDAIPFFFPVSCGRLLAHTSMFSVIVPHLPVYVAGFSARPHATVSFPSQPHVLPPAASRQSFKARARNYEKCEKRFGREIGFCAMKDNFGKEQVWGNGEW